MRKKKAINLALMSISMSLIFFGCGQNTQEAPKLLESIVASDSFRPVEYGDVGDIDTVCGTVVPTDYCHFFADNAKVKEIKVDIGDYVNKGDILATADVERISEEIEEISSQRHLYDDLFEKSDELYLINKAKLGFMLQTAYTVRNMEGAEEIKKSLDELEENNRYERMLHDYRDRQLEKKLSMKQKLLEGTTIVAKQSGYVTYVKDLSESNEAQKSENIVVISDYENCYIELPTVSLSEEFIHTEKSYRIFFTIVNGKRYDLEKYAYSPEELVVIENKQMYPFLKFYAPKGCDLPPAGSSVPVYRSADLVSNVLRIGYDSLFQDENGSFVYVKKEGAESKDDKEMRYVTVGKQTRKYVEVLSGLEEGELVYYTSGELLPAKYNEITLEETKYTVDQKANGYAIKKKVKSAYYSEYEGKVEEVVKSEGEVVEKGELICTIKTEQTASSLMKMQNEINKLNDNYALMVKESEKQIEELNKQVADIVTRTNLSTSVLSYDPTQEKPEEAVTEGEGSMDGEKSQMIFSSADAHTQIQLELEIERIRCEIKKQKIQLDYDVAHVTKAYEKAKKNNDGQGLIRITATDDGVLTGFSLEEGKNVKMQDRLYLITEEEADRLLHICKDVLQVGQKVTLEQKKADKTYEGKIVALGKSSRVYVTKEDGVVYLTTNGVNTAAESLYYVSVDDPEFFHEQIGFDLTYEESTMYGVFVVPIGTVRTEEIETKKYDYVFRVADGNLVKQYVTKPDRKGGEITTECIVAGVKAGDVLAIESE